MKINRALFTLFMYTKTHFSSISFYLNLSFSEFSQKATLIYMYIYISGLRPSSKAQHFNPLLPPQKSRKWHPFKVVCLHIPQNMCLAGHDGSFSWLLSQHFNWLIANFYSNWISFLICMSGFSFLNLCTGWIDSWYQVSTCNCRE